MLQLKGLNARIVLALYSQAHDLVITIFGSDKDGYGFTITLGEGCELEHIFTSMLIFNVKEDATDEVVELLETVKESISSDCFVNWTFLPLGLKAPSKNGELTENLINHIAEDLNTKGSAKTYMYSN